MKVVIGSDHRGVKLKQQVIDYLQKKGHNVVDVGPNSESSTDYPKFAKKVTSFVVKRKADRGILICFSGLGMSMAANKIKGIRAANCLNPTMARYSREHNNANVLVMAAGFVKEKLAKRILHVWLKTEFAGGRHLRRIKMFDK